MARRAVLVAAVARPVGLEGRRDVALDRGAGVAGRKEVLLQLEELLVPGARKHLCIGTARKGLDPNRCSIARALDGLPSGSRA